MEGKECLMLFNHLQKCFSHLEDLMAQLKRYKLENKELRLDTLNGFYVITNKERRLILDTLKNCKDIILKILQKVNSNIDNKLISSTPRKQFTMTPVTEVSYTEQNSKYIEDQREKKRELRKFLITCLAKLILSDKHLDVLLSSFINKNMISESFTNNNSTVNKYFQTFEETLKKTGAKLSKEKKEENLPEESDKVKIKEKDFTKKKSHFQADEKKKNRKYKIKKLKICAKRKKLHKTESKYGDTSSSKNKQRHESNNLYNFKKAYVNKLTSSDKYFREPIEKPLGFIRRYFQTTKKLPNKKKLRPRKSNIEDIYENLTVEDCNSPVHVFATCKSSVYQNKNSKSIGDVINTRKIKNSRKASISRAVEHSTKDPQMTIAQTVHDLKTVGLSVSELRSIEQPVTDSTNMKRILTDFRAIAHPEVDSTFTKNSIYDHRNPDHGYFSVSNFNTHNPSTFNKLQIPRENYSLVNQQQMTSNLDKKDYKQNQPYSMQMGLQSNHSNMMQSECTPQNNKFYSRQFISHRQKTFSTNYDNSNNQVNNNSTIQYQQSPSKAFDLNKDIESSIEYDLSKISPINFYSPPRSINPVTNPSNYGNSISTSPKINTFRQPKDQTTGDSRNEKTSLIDAVKRNFQICLCELKERFLLKSTTQSSKADSLYLDKKIPDKVVLPLDSPHFNSYGIFSKSSKDCSENLKFPMKKSEFSENMAVENQLKELKTNSDQKKDDIKYYISQNNYVYKASKTNESKDEMITASNNKSKVIEHSPCEPKVILESLNKISEILDKRTVLIKILNGINNNKTDEKNTKIKYIRQKIESYMNDSKNVICTEVCTSTSNKIVSSTTDSSLKIENDRNEGKNGTDNIVDEKKSFVHLDSCDNIKSKIMRKLTNTPNSRSKFSKYERPGIRKVLDLNLSFEDEATQKLRAKQEAIWPVVEVRTKKCSAEFDMSHENIIQDEFIIDGMLTSNDNSDCIISKGNHSDSERLGFIIEDKDITHVEEDVKVSVDFSKRRTSESSLKCLINKLSLTSQSANESEFKSDNEHVLHKKIRSLFKNQHLKRKLGISIRDNYKKKPFEEEKLNTKTMEYIDVLDEKELKTSKDKFKVFVKKNPSLERGVDIVIGQSRNKTPKREHGWMSVVIKKRHKEKSTFYSMPNQLEVNTIEIEQKTNKKTKKIEKETEKLKKYFTDRKNICKNYLKKLL